MLKKMLVVLFVLVMMCSGIYMYQYESDKQIATEYAEKNYGDEGEVEISIFDRDAEGVSFVVYLDDVQSYLCWVRR